MKPGSLTPSLVRPSTLTTYGLLQRPYAFATLLTNYLVQPMCSECLLCTMHGARDKMKPTRVLVSVSSSMKLRGRDNPAITTSHDAHKTGATQGPQKYTGESSKPPWGEGQVQASQGK